MTKKEIINEITGLLKYLGEEIRVTNFPELRQPGRGFHAYCIRYDKETDKAICYPWAGAENNYGWEIPVAHFTKKSLETFRDYLIFFADLA